MSMMFTLFQTTSAVTPYTLEELHKHMPERFDSSGNLNMNGYNLVLHRDMKKDKRFYNVCLGVSARNLNYACKELHHLFNDPLEFSEIVRNFDYTGRPIHTGDVLKIQYQEETTYIYCNICNGYLGFEIIHPVHVPLNFLDFDATTLLQHHEFLLGSKPISFEKLENESFFILVRFSNGEVAVTRNTIDFCQSYLDHPIFKIYLAKHHSLKEWVIVAAREQGEEGGLNILTGIPLSVDIKGI